MRPLADIESAIAGLREADDPPAERARALLALAEETLEAWVASRGATPTAATREGFRLLALHRQGADGLASFNACRETCREIVYHYNVIAAEADVRAAGRYAKLMAMVVMHLYLFVSGKLEQAGLGEFCCSARPLHAQVT